MTTVLVIGGTGMFGSMLLDLLARDDALELHATAREAGLAAELAMRHRRAHLHVLDAEAGADLPDVRAEWIINAIGLIKPYIRDQDAGDIRRAVALNTLFPFRLAAHAERSSARVIQIATDCVFSGREGPYGEDSPHDATDVYGKTKSLGEVPSPAMIHLRCSIIGPERKARRSLLAWFLGQPHGATVSGYRNHLWNGVTTLHFARICRALVRGEASVSGLQHVVAGDELSKYEMLREFADAYGRSDIRIEPSETSIGIDRRLRTVEPEVNAALWKAVGCRTPPTIAEQIAELAAETPWK